MEDRFTEAEIHRYIVMNQLAVDAKYVYEYWKKKSWLTKKGEPVKTLAAAVNVCNSIYLTRLKNEMQTSKKHQRKLEEAKLLYAEYNEQLQSKEWEAFRNFVLVVKCNECEICGSKTWLQIHHKSYKKAAKAWEYLPSEVVVLCRDCHKNIHKIKE
jgi:5-methylcytosine-specific restriction endonuclease McrA